MSSMASVHGEHQKMLAATLPAVTARSDVPIADLLSLLQPVQLCLAGSVPTPVAPLRTSPRGNLDSGRITPVPSSPERTRAPMVTVREESDEEVIEVAEEANE